MALSDDEERTFRKLETQLGQSRRELERLDAYYEGVQRIEQLGLAVPPELEQFMTVVNWPRVAVDSLEERLDIEGFRLPGEDEADEDLWAIWQANNLDEESQLAHLDALALRQAFVVVGPGDGGPGADIVDHDPDVPLVTVESPFEMAVTLDPRTRRPRAAAKVYRDGTDRFATLYLPDVTVWMEWGSGGRRGWVDVDRDEHGLGTPPVSVLTNRARTRNRGGVSEMADVITLTDAAARALTNAQLATETMAVPVRGVLGSTKGDFVDQDGKQLPQWEAYFGSLWALGNQDAKTFQFSAADLGNFTRIVEHYATLVSGLKGLPMRYLGANTANPPSAEGIRADEARLVKRAERVHRAFNGPWERTMRIGRRITDGDWDPALAAMETQWRDPSTPTRAQAADAVVKLYQAGLLPRRAAHEELGYSATRRLKLQRMFEEEAADPLLAGLLRDVPAPNGQPEPAAA